MSHSPELTTIADLWQAALARYEQTTGTRITELSQARTADDVLQEVRLRDKQFSSRRHDGSKRDKLRTYLSKALTRISELCGMIAHATKTVYPPSEAIFSAIRFLIQVANDVSADYDKIAEFFQDLGSFLEQIQIIGSDIPDIPQLHEALTKVLVSVLVLCGICAKQAKKKRIVKAFNSMLSGADEELENALQDFRKSINNEQLTGHKVVLKITHDTKGAVDVMHADVRDGFKRLEEKLDDDISDSEREKTLMWLSSLEFERKHLDASSKHHPDTGHWLLNSDKFSQWCNGDENTTLWCPGDPGTGKTVTISRVIDHVDETTKTLKDAIAYVYCEYSDSRTLDHIGIICSLTRQLVEQFDSIPPEVRDFRDRFSAKRSQPRDNVRLDLLKSLCSRFDRTYIFIDALDECPAENRLKLFRLVRTLTPTVRLFVTSRPHISLDTYLPCVSRLDMMVPDSDIQIYVEDEIPNHEFLSRFVDRDPSLLDFIVSRITQRAAGMFLLAYLQLERIGNEVSIRGVRQSLETLPDDINDFYEDAFSRIVDQAPQKRELARSTLSIVFRAMRPLTTEELSHALGVKPGDAQLDEDGLIEAEILVEVSCGLVSIDKKGKTAHLVHQTLYEHLESQGEKFLENSESNLAMSCLSYLSLDVFGNGPCESAVALEERLLEYQYFDYVCHYWGDHVRNAELEEDEGGMLALFSNQKTLAAGSQVLYAPEHRTKGWHDQYPRNRTMLHHLAYWGLENLFDFPFGHDTKINAQDSFGETALLLSARNGHMGFVRRLLEQGCTLNLRSKTGETALSSAARNGHDSIVSSLLEKGADVACEDREGWTALDWAVIGGHSETADQLLDPALRKHYNKDRLGKSLIVAGEAGNANAIQALLDSGADVDWVDEYASTPLMFAIPIGHEEATRMLLKNNANVNAVDIYDNSPLHWSIPHPAILRLLLQHGARVDWCNDTNQTALIWSAQDGHTQAIELLLEYGADVALKDKFGFTALHAAALKGHEDIVQLLIQKAANVDDRDNEGWTALHAAAIRQHEDVVNLLVKSTTNGQQIADHVALQLEDSAMNAILQETADQKSEGSTVVSGLRYAVQENKPERVQELLKNGANIDDEDVGGFTALTMSVFICEGPIDLIRLLVKRGADVNKCERNGMSALHLAVKWRQYEAVRLLVENGAHIDQRYHTWTPLLLAAKAGQTLTVNYLVEAGADPNAQDYHGRRALHWAAARSQHMAHLLLLNGAEVNATDRWGRTALVWAIQSTDIWIAKQLLDSDADAEVRLPDGATALHWSAYVGNAEMTTLLLDRGADVKTQTRHGLTCLHAAAFRGHDRVVKLLLQRGADPHSKCNLQSVDGGEAKFDERDDLDRSGLVPHPIDFFDGKLSITGRLHDFFNAMEDFGGVSNTIGWTAQEIAQRAGRHVAQRLILEHLELV